ncbi:MAG: hypothetical protein K6F08_01900 [bacterium]|nr:hypothetical protein [bacterium]
MKRYTKVRLAAALIALNTAFSAPMVMAANNVNQAKPPQVKEASAYNYVLTKAESGKRSEIVDYKKYCDDILFFEDELRNGSLKGLIDDFDYIIPEELSYSYFGFHAFKDGEETSYIFDLSSSALGSYALTHDFQMDLHEVTNAMREGKLSKSNFNMCYKTSDLDRYIYNLAKDKVKEKINANSEIQGYLNNGYELFILPNISIPSIRFSLDEYKNNSKVSLVDLFDGFLSWQIGKEDGKYVMIVDPKLDIKLVKNGSTLDYLFSLRQTYDFDDNKGEVKSLIDSLQSPKQFLKAYNIKESKILTQYNDYIVYVTNSISDLFNKVSIEDIKNQSISMSFYRQSLGKIKDIPEFNYFNYSLGRLDDSTYEKYIGEEMGK